MVVGGVEDRLAVPVPDWTATVTEIEVLPPAPVQSRVKVVSRVSAPLDWLPEVPLLPDQPPEAVPPEAVQLSALLAVQFRVAEVLKAAGDGVADRVTAGARVGSDGTAAERLVLPPPPPPHPAVSKVMAKTAMAAFLEDLSKIRNNMLHLH